MKIKQKFKIFYKLALTKVLMFQTNYESEFNNKFNKL